MQTSLLRQDVVLAALCLRTTSDSQQAGSSLASSFTQELYRPTPVSLKHVRNQRWGAAASMLSSASCSTFLSLSRSKPLSLSGRDMTFWGSGQKQRQETGAAQLGCKSAIGEGGQTATELYHAPPDLVLHDILDELGVDTTFTRAARTALVSELEKAGLWTSGEEPSWEDLDLASVALEIACEDDAMVSHSSVALPVDSYLARLSRMEQDLATYYVPSEEADRTPAAVFAAVEKFLYADMGFKRVTRVNVDPGNYYLNAVLTRRAGPAVMLALIYHELLRRLRRRGLLSVATEVVIPLDPLSLPQARVAGAPEAVEGGEMEGGGASADGLVFTPALALVEILGGLKRCFWPWKWHLFQGGSGFLEAAEAAVAGRLSGVNLGTGRALYASSASGAAESAAARAAQHRLERGIWTATGAGDMRRAMAAVERLLLVGVAGAELRDYGVLLVHCRDFQRAHSVLKDYLSSAEAGMGEDGPPGSSLGEQERATLVSLQERLGLILAERAWSMPSVQPVARPSNPDPW